MVANLGPNQCPSGALARRGSWSLEKKLRERCNCRKGDAELDWGPVGSERGQDRTPGREGIGNWQRSPPWSACSPCSSSRARQGAGGCPWASCSQVTDGFIPNFLCPSFHRVTGQLWLQGPLEVTWPPGPPHSRCHRVTL